MQRIVMSVGMAVCMTPEVTYAVGFGFHSRHDEMARTAARHQYQPGKIPPGWSP